MADWPFAPASPFSAVISLVPLTAPEKYRLSVELAASTAFVQLGLSASSTLPCLAIQIASFGAETSGFVFLQQTYRPPLGLAIRADVIYTVNNCLLLGDMLK